MNVYMLTSLVALHATNCSNDTIEKIDCILNILDEKIQASHSSITVTQYKLILNYALEELNLHYTSEWTDEDCCNFVSSLLKEAEMSFLTSFKEIDVEGILFMVPFFNDFFVLN